jgi:hypothetical protein
MARPEKVADLAVKLDLNNPEFQRSLFALERSAIADAVVTLRMIASVSWNQVYQDRGLRWERIISVRPPAGVEAIYSLRISRSARALAYRESEWMRLLLVSADHDATYGKK